ncbi:hypothetical protein B0H19DRAFT_1085079 [Mycena capillaripes]|nr:hypothetical protein B0H19DRAFT_1085079 [Mycena capillaripes]
MSGVDVLWEAANGPEKNQKFPAHAARGVPNSYPAEYHPPWHRANQQAAPGAKNAIFFQPALRAEKRDMTHLDAPSPLGAPRHNWLGTPAETAQNYIGPSIVHFCVKAIYRRLGLKDGYSLTGLLAKAPRNASEGKHMTVVRQRPRDTRDVRDAVATHKPNQIPLGTAQLGHFQYTLYVYKSCKTSHKGSSSHPHVSLGPGPKLSQGVALLSAYYGPEPRHIAKWSVCWELPAIWEPPYREPPLRVAIHQVKIYLTRGPDMSA